MKKIAQIFVALAVVSTDCFYLYLIFHAKQLSMLNWLTGGACIFAICWFTILGLLIWKLMDVTADLKNSLR